MKSCRQDNYFFLRVTFLSSSKLTVVFNISSSHANTNLPTRRFFA